MIVNMHEAKIHLAKYVEKALSGEEVIFSEAGKPMVALVPVSALKTVKRNTVILGTLAGAFKVPDNFDDPLPDEICNEFYKADL
jgi:prevent-host-death family protein